MGSSDLAPPILDFILAYISAINTCIVDSVGDKLDPERQANLYFVKLKYLLKSILCYPSQNSNDISNSRYLPSSFTGPLVAIFFFKKKMKIKNCDSGFIWVL